MENWYFLLWQSKISFVCELEIKEQILELKKNMPEWVYIIIHATSDDLYNVLNYERKIYCVSPKNIYFEDI